MMRDLMINECSMIAGGGDFISKSNQSRAGSYGTHPTDGACFVSVVGNTAIGAVTGGAKGAAGNFLSAVLGCFTSSATSVPNSTTVGINYSGGTGGGLTSYGGGTYAGGTYDGGNSPTSAYC